MSKQSESFQIMNQNDSNLKQCQNLQKSKQLLLKVQKFTSICKILMLLTIILLTLILVCCFFIFMQKNHDIIPFPPEQVTNIAHIWIGGSPLPKNYTKILQEHGGKVLKQKQQYQYIQRWNKENSQKAQLLIDKKNYNFIEQIDMLKLLHLYYNGGVYIDFDIKFNETCIRQALVPYDQMFFTVPNRGGYFLIPDEGFLSAPTAYNPMVRRMLIKEIHERYRWLQCIYRQCATTWCTESGYDGSYYWNVS